jgi:two-component system, NarL family, sensor histidine kinase UhpB
MLTSLNNTLATGQVKYWEDTYRFKKKDGTYAFVQDRAHIIYSNGAASRMIGATQDITERVLLQNELAAQGVNRQKEIAAAVMATLEKERLEVGEELNEHISQVLVAINMYIEIAKKNADNREKYLDKSSAHVKELLLEIRTISNRLLIPDIRISGLVDNIKNLIADMARSYPVRIELLTEDIDGSKLSQNLQLNLYRIVQEQLANVIKHSDATNAIISLKLNGKQLKILIRDNGIGCDHPLEKKSVGISNILTRVQILNGEMTLLSSHQKGYSVKMVIPIT